MEMSCDMKVYCALPVLDVSFTVQLDSDILVTEGDVIKFDKIISNNGGGYSEGGSNHGKFIAPINGMHTLSGSNSLCHFFASEI